MKITRFNFPSNKKSAISKRQNKEKRARKLLENLDYTPHAARLLAGILRTLSDESPRRQDEVLETFTKIVREQ